MADFTLPEEQFFQASPRAVRGGGFTKQKDPPPSPEQWKDFAKLFDFDWFFSKKGKQSHLATCKNHGQYTPTPGTTYHWNLQDERFALLASVVNTFRKDRLVNNSVFAVPKVDMPPIVHPTTLAPVVALAHPFMSNTVMKIIATMPSFREKCQNQQYQFLVASGIVHITTLRKALFVHEFSLGDWFYYATWSELAAIVNDLDQNENAKSLMEANLAKYVSHFLDTQNDDDAMDVDDGGGGDVLFEENDDLPALDEAAAAATESGETTTTAAAPASEDQTATTATELGETTAATAAREVGNPTTATTTAAAPASGDQTATAATTDSGEATAALASREPTTDTAAPASGDQTTATATATTATATTASTDDDDISNLVQEFIENRKSKMPERWKELSLHTDLTLGTLGQTAVIIQGDLKMIDDFLANPTLSDAHKETLSDMKRVVTMQKQTVEELLANLPQPRPSSVAALQPATSQSQAVYDELSLLVENIMERLPAQLRDGDGNTGDAGHTGNTGDTGDGVQAQGPEDAVDADEGNPAAQGPEDAVDADEGNPSWWTSTIGTVKVILRQHKQYVDATEGLDGLETMVKITRVNHIAIKLLHVLLATLGSSKEEHMVLKQNWDTAQARIAELEQAVRVTGAGGQEIMSMMKQIQTDLKKTADLEREKERGEHELEREKLATERDGLKKKRDELESERTVLMSKQLELMSERDKLATEWDGLKTERDELESERDDLMSSQEQQRKELNELQGKYKNLQTERDELESELASERDKHESQLKAEWDKSAETESTELKKQLDGLKKQLEDATQQQWQSAETESTQRVQLESASRQAQQTLQQMQKDLKTSQEKCSKLESASEQAQQLQKDLDASQAKCRELDSASQQLQKDLDESLKTSREECTKRQQLEKELKTSRDTLTSSQEKCSRLKDRIKAHEAFQNTLNETISNLNGRIDEMKVQLDHYRQQNQLPVFVNTAAAVSATASAAPQATTAFQPFPYGTAAGLAAHPTAAPAAALAAADLPSDPSDPPPSALVQVLPSSPGDVSKMPLPEDDASAMPPTFPTGEAFSTREDDDDDDEDDEEEEPNDDRSRHSTGTYKSFISEAMDEKDQLQREKGLGNRKDPGPGENAYTMPFYCQTYGQNDHWLGTVVKHNLAKGMYLVRWDDVEGKRKSSYQWHYWSKVNRHGSPGLKQFFCKLPPRKKKRPNRKRNHDGSSVSATSASDASDSEVSEDAMYDDAWDHLSRDDPSYKPSAESIAGEETLSGFLGNYKPGTALPVAVKAHLKFVMGKDNKEKLGHFSRAAKKVLENGHKRLAKTKPRSCKKKKRSLLCKRSIKHCIQQCKASDQARLKQLKKLQEAIKGCHSHCQKRGGFKSIGLAQLLMAIFEQLREDDHLLVADYDDPKAQEEIKNITTVISYGQFVLFVAMINEEKESITVVRRNKENPKEFGETEEIFTLWFRLIDWIMNPESWLALHHCGNGFMTFGCDESQHIYAGTALLNAKHFKIHVYLLVMKDVDECPEVYEAVTKKLLEAFEDFPTSPMLPVFFL